MLLNINWMRWIPNIITAIVMAVMGWQLQHYKQKAEAVSIEFRYFKNEQTRLVGLEKAKQAQQREAFEKALDQQQQSAKQAYDTLANEFKKVVKSDANNQKIIDDQRSINDQLHAALAASVSARADAARHPRRDTRGGQQCDGTIARDYKILTLAATKTTLDYNRCRLWMDHACSIVKCE